MAFQLLAFLAPVLGMVAPLGEAPLVILGGAAIVMLNLASGRAPRAPARYVVLFGALIALSLLSCLWTIDLSLTASRAIRLLGEAIIGLALIDAAKRIDADGQQRVIIGLIAGIALGAIIVLVDAVLHHSLIASLRPSRPTPTEFDRGATTLVVLVWPLLIYLLDRRNRRLVVALSLVVIVVVGYLMSDAAKLALSVGVVGAISVYWGRNWVAKPLRYVLPLGILIMPLLATSLPPPESLIQDRPVAKASALHRLVIWQFTGQRILERPWLGWGLETSRDLPGADHSYQIEHLPGAPPMVALSLHPHNGALQIWVELGVIGALLGAGLLFFVTQEGLTLNAVEQAGLYGGLISVLVIAMLSYGIWQSWWDEELWLFAALMGMVLSRRQDAV
jgi:hypothetical protein